MKTKYVVTLGMMWLVTTLFQNPKDETVVNGEKLVGKWIVQKAERNGKQARELEGAKYEFHDNTMTMKPRDEKAVPRNAKYQVREPEAVGKPMRILFKPDEGPNKGEEMEGIFRFKDDMLEFCHCTVRRESKGFQPADFVTKPNSGWVLMTLKKEQ